MSTQKPVLKFYSNFICNCQFESNQDVLNLGDEGEWVNKLGYIQTMGYSTTKRNELPRHERTNHKIWRKTKCTLRSEGSLSENATYCMISFI